MNTISRKLLLGAAALGTALVAGCAHDPYYDNAYYGYNQSYGYTYDAPSYRYYGYAPRYYYGPRYYSYGYYTYPDRFWRGQPQPG